MINILDEAASCTGVSVHEQAILPSESLSFSQDLLDYCKTNVCGNYNKSWTCPPACGSLEEQQRNILSFKNVLIFTTMHKLEDSFDYEGMTKGRGLHTLLLIELKNKLGDVPVYGAGNCPVCMDKEGKSICAFPSPCPFPEKMIRSIEAAGINVTELSKSAKITYNNGENTVTYFSMVLID